MGTSFIKMDGYDIIVLDTEGLDYVTDNSRDAAIFTCALLISSLLVYSFVGLPSQQALDYLAFILATAARIKGSADSEKSERDTIGFPAFLWLCRDQHLDPVVAGKRVSWSAYLQSEVLNVTAAPGASREEYQRAKLRETIRKRFPSVDMAALPHPKPGMGQGEDLSRLSDAQFSPDFVSEWPRVAARLRSSTLPKKMLGGSEECNGAMLASLLEILVPALNEEGAIVQLGTLHDRYIAEEADKLQGQVLAKFQAELEALTPQYPLDESEWVKLHHEVKDRTLLAVHKDALSLGSEAALRITEKLEQRINELLTRFQRRNEEASRKACTELIVRLLKPVIARANKQANDKFTRIEDLLAAMSEVRVKYLKEAKGPGKPDGLQQLEAELANLADSFRATLTQADALTEEKLKHEMERVQSEMETQRLSEQEKRAQEEQREKEAAASKLVYQLVTEQAAAMAETLKEDQQRRNDAAEQHQAQMFEYMQRVREQERQERQENHRLFTQFQVQLMEGQQRNLEGMHALGAALANRPRPEVQVQPRGPSTMDKIGQGVGIVSQVMGIIGGL